ncbi:2-hydroxyhepta-2,4-diene-1,7-dioate isomerase [Micromonospora ureilytica]|uniref:2-hydroxyhepta-2,4-diene-1,7-dioate isomerase n=1 Tax=Micromonospora ureilytica TaxID=709868 RepID=A0A3N9XTC8_9ACTN|nr:MULTISPECIES: fumarylacetoacetate hydrolase family protein [Micromonospora]MBG6067465.1 2-keto-4-pentenoate hydratase/2-oxohepta-3-ene-1,7-dioic acid hydratase in catechol pathway [Micromonospora ureilytica]MBQ1017840.1 fumarylacetoacetate hydrolase family protein [Micromonospora sp. D93]RQX16039.1 2-hydroxyhepta-2,4-diene-1,7-dioate isomerase [Micromonospora ureilytica]WSG30759.1 fumarylacetoacetate hydrolase family protein [Micromonospora ureilytica]WSR59074.1 fumarylacetoacetate hydrolas
MRIARFAHAKGMSFGAVEGEPEAGPQGLTIAEIEGHPFGKLSFSGARWALSDVRLLSPILPSKVVCVGRNYADHAAELGNDVPKEPLLFLKPSTSVIGPRDAIRLPIFSKQVEHEAELAVVIGAPGARRADRAAAERAIFGYTCANDVTARDLQRSDAQWTRAKGFDSFCPIGPWITTGLDVSDLEIRCEVGRNPEEMEVRQLGRTKDMVFDVPGLVSYISHVMTLLPGDVVLTGTPAGVSPLVEGDTVTVRIDGIGELTNPVVPVA